MDSFTRAAMLVDACRFEAGVVRCRSSLAQEQVALRGACADLARTLREKNLHLFAGFVLSHIEPQVVCLGSCAVWLELAPSLRQKQIPLRGTSAMQCFATHGAYE